MSLAAGIGLRDEGQRENGPATRADAFGQHTACEGSGGAHLLWRTVQERRQAPPAARFLIGLARPLR